MNRHAVTIGPSTGEVLVTFKQTDGELKNHLLRAAPGIRAQLVDLEERRAAVERSRRAKLESLVLTEPAFSKPEPGADESEEAHAERVQLAVEDHRRALDTARLEHVRAQDEANRAHDQLIAELDAERNTVNRDAFAAAEKEIADALEAAKPAPAVESHAP